MFKLTLSMLAGKGARADMTVARARGPARSRVALLLLALAPACYIGVAIRLYGVDLPIWDEWNLAVLFDKFARGTLTLGDLFAQQNEYRQFFPNLIFLITAWLTKWDVRYEMLVSFLLACLIAYNIYCLGELTLRCGRTNRLCLFAAASLLLFSPAQYDNWLQGQQLIYFIPAVCLTTGLRITYTNNLRPWAKLLLCAALSTVATFSAANGLLCWLLLPCALARRVPITRPLYRRAWLLLWLAGFALCVGLYFYGYQKPPQHPSLLHPLAHPLVALVYFLSLLGGPFGMGHLRASVSAGVLVLALSALTWWRCKRGAQADAEETGRMLGWLLLGAYTLLTACLITASRVGFGVEQSLSARYTTYTLFLPLALVYLSQCASVAAYVPRATPSLLLCALLLLHAPIYLLGIRRMSVMHATQMHAKACVLLVNVVKDDCQAQVFPDPTRLRRSANTLDWLGYMRPPLLTSNRLRDLAAADARAPEIYGIFTRLAPSGADEYTATGLAVLPERGSAADAVLLARSDVEHEPFVFAVAEMESQSDFLSALLRRDTYDDAHWHRTFSVRDLPVGTDTITAWAFDAHTGKAYRLAGEYVLARE
ncbi:MAG: hypothetical protein ACJ74W_00090 [Pyrinomonadaceae bacterium]